MRLWWCVASFSYHMLLTLACCLSHCVFNCGFAPVIGTWTALAKQFSLTDVEFQIGKHWAGKDGKESCIFATSTLNTRAN